MKDILLVEDDPLIARMLTLRLSLAGFSVTNAINGARAVQEALTGQFRLILMDMHMPVMSGQEAVRILRDKGYAGLIVAVTASVFAEDDSRSMQAGCDDSIRKPIGDDFEQRVKTLLESLN